MTATVETYAGNLFRLIEAKSNTKFCDICNGQFIRTAYYREIKSNIHSATPNKINLFRITISLVRERLVMINHNYEDV